ncbi:MAG TPA: outer membrane beta-barrel protein [Candidatus Saccharimonadales bacterium]|nr:outer membrane beta-barrel protein [Candidatus Saccharimonadales bacterium]
MFACLFVALACTPALAAAQTSSLFSNLANPSIGMNALFSAQAAHNLNQPYGLHFDEAEISVISVVDPYWTLVSNIVFLGDGSVDPEEVWVRSTNIPGIQLKLGKLRGTFGKHGLLHTHAFPFIQAPVIMANTIGNEGFKDAGIEAAWLTPLPWFSELTGGVYQAVATDSDHPLDFGSTNHSNVPFLVHFKNQFDLNEATTMELGQSILQGRGTDGNRHAAYGADLTFRNVPPRDSNRRGWILQGEYIQKGSYVDGNYNKEQNGWYASFQYRLSQVWWMGVRGEQARDSYTDFLVDAQGDPVPGTVTRVSANLAWMPSEFSFVRLEYSHATADGGVHPTDDRLAIQMSYTIGYHPAHAY